MLDTMLDEKLAAKLSSFEERLGKLRAWVIAVMNHSGKN
jgi:hypothetical protein